MERYELFKQKWQQLSNIGPKPQHLNSVSKINFSEFSDIILNRKFSKAERLVEEIYAGTAYIIEKALSEQEVKRLKSLALEFESSHEAARLKIVGDCPD